MEPIGVVYKNKGTATLKIGSVESYHELLAKFSKQVIFILMTACSIVLSHEDINPIKLIGYIGNRREYIR